MYWPKAQPYCSFPAQYKGHFRDFKVCELAGHPVCEDGEHLYVYLEKRQRTTVEVAHWLADYFGVPEYSVGYAGMKDKHALTQQWFSVHLPGKGALPGLLRDDAVDRDAGVFELKRHRAEKKLRRGNLTGNHFSIQVAATADVEWQQDALIEVLNSLTTKGFPNYFGPQRFGRDNLAAARRWLSKRPQRRLQKQSRRHNRGRADAAAKTNHFMDGLYLSVLRSFLFNEVLSHRLANDCWTSSLPGEVLQDGTPTGPLWGRGRLPTQGQAREIEKQALAPHSQLCEDLEFTGLTQQRRALVCKPKQLQWQFSKSSCLTLDFELPAGSYATSLLNQLFSLSDLSAMHTAA